VAKLRESNRANQKGVHKGRLDLSILFQENDDNTGETAETSTNQIFAFGRGVGGKLEKKPYWEFCARERAKEAA